MCCTNNTGFESRYYFKGIVYQGSTDQDTVVSSLLANVKKILNDSSFKCQSESHFKVALSKSIHISTTNHVKYSGLLAEVQTPVMSNPIVILGHHLALICIWHSSSTLLLNYYWTACYWKVLIQL